MLFWKRGSCTFTLCFLFQVLVFLTFLMVGRVQACDLIVKWGVNGSGDGQFDLPHGVAVDGSGNVYVVDSWNDRIQKFNSSGTFLTKWGAYGTGNGWFDKPHGVAVDSSGNVYVADTYNHRIQKFDSSGTYLTQWGSYGSGGEQFNYPEGVAVDSSGNVYVADTSNHRIQEIDMAGTSASAWTTVGSTGTVDDADVSLAVFSGPTVTVSSAVAVATLDLRYNLVEYGLLEKPLGLDAVYLKVCYRDNGGSAQVIVKLWALNFNTGATTTLMTFDSNAFTASGSFQSKSISNCPGGGITFDFLSKAYYLEVALKKFSSAGGPGAFRYCCRLHPLPVPIEG